eukprot:12930289-Prorocentrum_lima.AAC.1
MSGHNERRSRTASSLGAPPPSGAPSAVARTRALKPIAGCRGRTFSPYRGPSASLAPPSPHTWGLLEAASTSLGGSSNVQARTT